MDRDLGPPQELIGALLIDDWCLKDLQGFKITPPEPQNQMPGAFAMQNLSSQLAFGAPKTTFPISLQSSKNEHLQLHLHLPLHLNSHPQAEC